MGGASISVYSTEIWSNPSLAAGLTHLVVSLNYAPRLFELEELSRASAVIVAPTSVGAFAVSGSRFGFELYREIILTGTYSASLGPGCLIGLNLNWYSLSIQNYGSATCLGADVGLLVTLREGLHWGFAAQNVNGPTVGADKEKIPQVYSTGLSYQPIDESTIGVDLVKDVHYPTEVRLGFEYSLLDLVDVRVGTSSDPSTYGAGIGVRTAGFEFDYAFRVHPDLGTTHQLSFSVSFGQL